MSKETVSKIFLYLIKQCGMPVRKIVEVELHELLNMAMNGSEIKFYCQFSSRPTKQPTVWIVLKADWTPVPVWTQWRNSLFQTVENRTMHRHVSNRSPDNCSDWAMGLLSFIRIDNV